MSLNSTYIGLFGALGPRYYWHCKFTDHGVLVRDPKRAKEIEGMTEFHTRGYHDTMMMHII